MAFGSLLALLDDIATILDDVSVMTKVAAKKTAGVLGDDLALNAQQVSGVHAERELPVVWAVAKGSFINKLILVPSALIISVLAPWIVTPLLMLGGAYLCYEGFEKVLHALMPSTDNHAHDEALHRAVQDSQADLATIEKDKIKGAIRTDFILSAEIIVIALGTVASAPLAQKISVLSIVAIAMTIGVYGLVAGIVKLDDAGLFLLQRSDTGLTGTLLRKTGLGLLAITPILMRGLSVLGTIAMFLVGGGIIIHGWPWLHALVSHIHHFASQGWVAVMFDLCFNAMVGLITGGIILPLHLLISKIK